MTSFDDKERAHETKYALDQEKEFKVIARRNKLLGLWAAELMGKHGDEANAYAKTVVLSDFEEPGDDDVFRKVQSDLKAAKLSIGDDEIKKKMNELMGDARRQIEGDGQ